MSIIKDQPEKLTNKHVEEFTADDLYLSRIFNELSKSEYMKEATLILNMLGYLKSSNIPTKMFIPLTKDEKIIKESINLLQENSVIDLNLDKNTLNIKEKNQIAIRSMCQTNKKEENCLCELILLIFEYSIDDSFWNDNLLDIEHGLEVWKHISKYDNLIALSDLLPYFILENLRSTMRFEEANKFGRSAYEILKKACGKDQPGTLKLRCEFAMLLNDIGQFNEALDILKPIMAKNYSHWHDEDQIDVMLNVAKQLCELNRYEESESIYKNILSRYIMVLENDEELYLDVFVTYSRLLHDMGKYNESIKILKKSLEKKSSNPTSSPYDADILDIKNGIGNNLSKLNKTKEALECFQEVYNKKKFILGLAHPDTLRINNYIGEIYCKQNKIDDAINIFNNVVENLELAFGIEHPDTLYALTNLGSALKKKGELEKSLEIYKKLYKIRKEAYGLHHDETLTVRRNIGALLLNSDRFSEAQKVFTEVYVNYKMVFGPYNPRTIEIRDVLDSLENSEYSDESITTIHDAVRENNLESVKNFITNGININYKDIFENTPLHYASEYGHVNVLQFLLKNGAYYNSKNEDEKTPFQLANNSAIKNILKSIADLFSQVKAGNYEKVCSTFSEQLMKNEILLNARDESGSTVLHWAVNKSFKDITTLLLENQADPTLKTNKGNTSLHIATSQGLEEFVELLLRHVDNSNVVKSKMQDFVNAATLTTKSTCVHVAAKNGKYNILLILLKYGAYFDAKNKEDQSALDLAKDFKQENIIPFLQMIADLFEYSKIGDIEIINKLKNLKPDEFSAITNTRNYQGKTLLQVAMINKQKNIVSELMELLRKSNNN